MEHDHLRPRALGDPGGVVEHAHGHVELLATLGVAHEASDGCMDGKDDAGVASQLAEPLGPGIVHPELPLEVDLAGGVTVLLEDLDRLLRALARGQPSRAEVELGHVPKVLVTCLAPAVSRAWHRPCLAPGTGHVSPTLVSCSRSRHVSI